MDVISKAHLKELIEKHPQAEGALLAWHKITRAANWTRLSDVRQQFPSADMIGMVIVFNILHNDLRLITVASWRSKRIYVKALLTHKQYDRKEWMKWA